MFLRIMSNMVVLAWHGQMAYCYVMTIASSNLRGIHSYYWCGIKFSSTGASRRKQVRRSCILNNRSDLSPHGRRSGFIVTQAEIPHHVSLEKISTFRDIVGKNIKFTTIRIALHRVPHNDHLTMRITSQPCFTTKRRLFSEHAQKGWHFGGRCKQS